MVPQWLVQLAEKLAPISIVDAHQHLGRSMFSHTTTRAEDLIAGLDDYGVAQAMVMPQPDTGHPAEIHNAIAATAEAHPQRVFGMINMNPRLPRADYRAEVKRCVEELDFKAIKLHPLGHSVSIAAEEARLVFVLAAEYDLPVLIHTGTGNPQALPSLALRPAKAFPEVAIVLCHAGWSVYSDEAIVAAEMADNIFLEPSWCGPYQIQAMIAAIGAERVLFGSDHLNNIGAELSKFCAIGLADEALKLCLAENARRLFKLSAIPS